MDIQLEKYKLVEWLINLRDESTILKLKNLQKTESSQWSKEISETEKSLIEVGLKDLEEGNIYTHKEVTEEIKKIYDL